MLGQIGISIRAFFNQIIPTSHRAKRDLLEFSTKSPYSLCFLKTLETTKMRKYYQVKRETFFYDFSKIYPLLPCWKLRFFQQNIDSASMIFEDPSKPRQMSFYKFKSDENRQSYDLTDEQNRQNP